MNRSDTQRKSNQDRGDPIPLTDQRPDGRVAAMVFIVGVSSLLIVAVAIACIVRLAQGLA